MIYNLEHPLDCDRFATRANILMQRKGVVELTEKVFRSGNQNRYIHLLIGVVAMDVGVTLDYAKREYFKKLVNRDIFVRKVQDKFCGEGEHIRSSAELSMEEMTIAIDRFKRWGAENGFYFPSPEDEARLKDIEIEMGRIRQYL
jgi:hypothetical protein